jgi:hypothetical protein
MLMHDTKALQYLSCDGSRLVFWKRGSDTLLQVSVWNIFHCKEDVVHGLIPAMEENKYFFMLRIHQTILVWSIPLSLSSDVALCKNYPKAANLLRQTHQSPAVAAVTTQQHQGHMGIADMTSLLRKALPYSG